MYHQQTMPGKRGGQIEVNPVMKPQKRPLEALRNEKNPRVVALRLQNHSGTRTPQIPSEYPS